MMLLSGVLLLHYHTTMTRQADETMRNSLRRAALACSLVVDPGIHRSFMDASQQDSAAYLAACARLGKALTNMEGPERFRFVYTCVLRGGAVHFILDPTPAGDADGDGVDDKAYLMQPYPEACPELRTTLKSGAVTVMHEPQSDPWGTFLSAHAPVLDESGTVIAAVGVDMDLTFYQGTIRDIRTTTSIAAAIVLLISTMAGCGLWYHENRLRAAIHMIEKAREEANTANQAKNRFLATMSHELRTPMNGFLGMADLLLTTPLSAVQRDYVETIQTSGDRLLSVLDDILDFSKTETEALKLEKKSTRIDKIVKEVIRLHTPLARSKRIRLDAEIRPGAAEIVETDPARLKQVLVHLVGNAVEHTDSGSVEVSVAHHRVSDGPPCIRFTVKDSGIGIPMENRHHLFQPFHQLDSSASRQHGGIGLGLALCDRLSRAIGGIIEFDSEPGKGSTFHFTLPVEPDGKEPSAEVASGQGSPDPVLPAQGHLGHALLICPDRLLSRLLHRLLAKQGWHVSVSDSAEGMRPADITFGLVVLDLALAREPVVVFVNKAIAAIQADQHAVIDVGLSEDERAKVLLAGASTVITRNPSFASLSSLVSGGAPHDVRM